MSHYIPDSQGQAISLVLIVIDQVFRYGLEAR
jgi:hypothetical protein